jgi:hypothetical protein
MHKAGGGGGRGLFASHPQLHNFHFIAALALNFNDRLFLCTFTSYCEHTCSGALVGTPQGT